MNAPESIQTEDVRGYSLSNEVLEEEHVVHIDVDVDTSHYDVIHADINVSECITSEDILVKMNPSKYLAQKHLEAATATDDSYCAPICNPNGEYYPYREDPNISDALVDEVHKNSPFG